MAGSALTESLSSSASLLIVGTQKQIEASPASTAPLTDRTSAALEVWPTAVRIFLASKRRSPSQPLAENAIRVPGGVQGGRPLRPGKCDFPGTSRRFPRLDTSV